jgi:hypothetical protein
MDLAVNAVIFALSLLPYAFLAFVGLLTVDWVISWFR